MKNYISALFGAVLLTLTANSQTLIERTISPKGQIFDMERKDSILYVGGGFNKVGYFTGGIAYLQNIDTLPDLKFPYIKGEVFAIISDGNGGWYVGGKFDITGIELRNNLVHILPDFTVNKDFAPIVNNQVNSLDLDGNILYIGGNFTMIDGTPRKYLAAYNISTNQLTDFDPEPNLGINTLKADNGNLYVGGFFSSIGDSAFRGLACIDLSNSVVQSFPQAGIGQVNVLTISDNILYVGGSFSGGAFAIDLSTKTITNWVPQISGLFGLRVNDILIRDTIVYVAGSFTKAMGQNRKNMAAIGLSGTLIEGTFDVNAEIFSLAWHDGYIYVGGDFTQFNGKNQSFVTRINDTFEPDTTWNLGTDWAIQTMVFNGDDLIVGGEFTMLHFKERNNAFAINLNSNTILDWNPQGNFLNITDIEIDATRNIVYLAGYDYQTMQNVKAFDDSEGNRIENLQLTFNGTVNTVDHEPSTGNIYVGGGFTTINAQSANRLAGVTPDGSLIALNVEPNGDVRKISYSNQHGLIYFSGDFTEVGDSIRNKVAAIDFQGNITGWNPQLSYTIPNSVYVNGIIPLKDRIFLGGFFETIQGVERKRIGAVDPLTGEVLPWKIDVTTTSPSKGGINSMIEFNNGIVIAGDNIITIGNQAFNHLALLSKNSGNTLLATPFFGLSTGNEQIIIAMEEYGHELIMGGTFLSLKEYWHPYLAKMNFPDNNNINLGDRIDWYWPKTGGNTGDVSLEITGTGLTGNVLVYLKDQTTQIDAALNATFTYDNNRLLTTFDLRGENTGYYDIVIEIPGDTTIILQNAFQIVEGTEPLTYADVVTTPFLTLNAESYMFISYGNSGNIDAHGVPVWLAFSPNIEILDIGFDVIRLMDETNPYYDSVPEYISIDTLFGEPFSANVYSFIIPKIPANSSYVIAVKIKPDNLGEFYATAWTDRPLFGSPLKYWVGDCYDALFQHILGYVPGASCAYGIIDILVSPYTDFAWDPNFGTFNWALSYFELNVTTTVECIGAFVTGGIGKFLVTLIKDILSAKAFIDLFQKCSAPLEKEPLRGEVVASKDPNDKTGVSGYGKTGWINTARTFPYIIRFENEPDATAPAKLVRIVDTLNPEVFDLNTLKLKGFTIAGNYYSLPNGISSADTIIDIRPRLPYLVQLSSELDSQNGLLTWEFNTLDPSTLEQVTGALDGFLPPNKDTISGTGSVIFDIQVHNDIGTGTRINNKAEIYFDFNEPIITNTWSLVADNVIPQSTMLPTPDTVYNETFTLSWYGDDEGSGIKNYDVLFRENGGNWYFAARQTGSTSIGFTGERGNLYEFYTIAYDSALNKQVDKAIPIAKTFVAEVTPIAKTEHETSVQVFPNPSDGILYINFDEVNQDIIVRILDVSGRLIITKKFTDYDTTIDLNINDLPSGLYLIQINLSDRFIQKKVFKN